MPRACVLTVFSEMYSASLLTRSPEREVDHHRDEVLGDRFVGRAGERCRSSGLRDLEVAILGVLEGQIAGRVQPGQLVARSLRGFDSRLQRSPRFTRASLPE